MKSPRRVLFLAADACDPDLVRQWAAEGELPFFANLLQTSLRAPTHGPVGVWGGGLWPTFVTGTTPGRHGLYAFRQYSPESYLDERAYTERLAEEPFWLRLDRAGRRVGLLDVPLAPARSLVNGFHATYARHDKEGPGPLCSSSSVAQEIERVAGSAPMPYCEGRRQTVAEFRELRDSLLQQCHRRTRLALHFLDKGEWDLFACVFAESHCVGHQMWHFHDPAHPKHDPEDTRRLGGDPLLDVYRIIDQELAMLARQAGDDTMVVVWCSHGMGPHYDATFLLDTILQRLEDPAKAEFQPLLGSAWQTWKRIPWDWKRPLLWPLPTLRRIEDRRFAAHRRGRSFFAIEDNQEQGAIRINLVGRDANGLVQPGTEYEEMLAGLREALLELENAETGTPIVAGFQYPQARNPGPYSKDLPDMTVDWDRSRPIRRIRSPRIGLIDRPSSASRSGDHKQEGLIFALHPALRPGEIDRSLDATALAPTITRLIGVAPEGFDATPIPEFLASDATAPDVPDLRVRCT